MDIVKFIRSSKESAERKSALQEAFQYYQTAFYTLLAAYSTLAGEIVASDICAEVVNSIRTNIARTCVDSIKEAFKSSLDATVCTQFSEACSTGIRDAVTSLKLSAPASYVKY